MTRILIVEDEPDIALGLEDDLAMEGYRTAVASDGIAALARARDETWDLILLDVMLPGKDGFEICRELRRAGDATPIILLTAKSHEAEKVMGLELGADDYVTKPFSPRELRARIKARLRGHHRDAGERFQFGDLEVDLERAEVKCGGKVAELTALECKLLTAFIRNRGRILTREQLIEKAWGVATHITDRAVDTHIKNLRRKIEPEPAEPRYLRSVRGLGCRFDS